MKYELSRELKDAGFPQRGIGEHGFLIEADGTIDCNCGTCDIEFGVLTRQGADYVYLPTLSELIEACGDGFGYLARRDASEWDAIGYPVSEEHNKTNFDGSTPEEAVARLYIALNKPN